MGLQMLPHKLDLIVTQPTRFRSKHNPNEEVMAFQSLYPSSNMLFFDTRDVQRSEYAITF